MAGTLKIEGQNLVLQVNTTGNTWLTVGCANSINEKATTDTLSVKCDGDGTTPTKHYGETSYSFDINGIDKFYSAGEASTQWGADDFIGLKQARTKKNFRIVEWPIVASTSKIYTYGGCIISDVSRSHSNGSESTYSVSLEADSYAITTAPD